MNKIISKPSTKILLILLCLVASVVGSEQSSLKKVFFENHSNFSDTKLESMVSVFHGMPIDRGNARAIADSVQTKLRTKSKLAYAVVSSFDRKNGVVTIRVGQYHNIDERIINDMKNHKIEKGKINRVFFKGNKNITTKELTISIKGFIGKLDTKESRQKIIDKVNMLYANRGHKNISGRFEAIMNDDGIFFIRIENKR